MWFSIGLVRLCTNVLGRSVNTGRGFRDGAFGLAHGTSTKLEVAVILMAARHQSDEGCEQIRRSNNKPSVSFTLGTGRLVHLTDKPAMSVNQ